MLYEGLNTCASCCELLYTCNRPEWHLGDEVTRKPCRVLCGLARRQASLLSNFNRLAVALAKSQDHRALCGVFAFGLPRCGTSVVKARDTLHTSGPKQGRWAESRAGWCTNSLDDANATGGSMLGNVAGEAKRGAVTVGLRFAQGFTSWGLRKRWT